MKNTQPIIPPAIFLGIAALAFFVALAGAFIAGAFGIITIAALAIGVTALIAWGFFAPDQFRALLTGRTLRFGGLSLLVTVVVLTALIAVYSVVKNQNWRIDLTEQDTFSLTAEAREAITALGADPNVPRLKILAFYGITEAGRRDQDTLLFDDYVSAAGDKLSYEYIDPDKAPVLTQQLNITRPGQVAVLNVNPDGTDNLESAQVIDFVTQEQLTNALLRVAASGDFRAYFLSVEGALQLENADGTGLATLNEVLTQTLQWKTQSISLLEIASGQVNLNDPLADGILLVIPGGKAPLSDENLATLTQYLDNGGDAIIFSDVNLTEDEPTLATAENLSTYLKENYGVSFSQSVLLDTQQPFQSEFELYTTQYIPGNAITNPFSQVDNATFVFETPNPIEIADQKPPNVTVMPLITSSDAAFAKSLAALLAGDFTQQPDDPTGPFTLAAAAENTETGSRVVLISSKQVPSDRYLAFRSLNVLNIDLSLGAALWTTDFEEFFSRVPAALTREARPQDTPLYATPQTLTTINFVTVLVIPFGILAIGIYTWWIRRTRAAKEI